MQNIALCMRTWREVRNLASQKFRLTPVYECVVPGNRPKTSSFRLPYQSQSSSTDCTRELFKPSKDSASLLFHTRKKIFWLRVADFCEWRHNKVVLGLFWLMLPIESFQPLINFLAFLVRTL